MTQPDPATRAERRKALTKMYEDEMAAEAASPAALDVERLGGLIERAIRESRRKNGLLPDGWTLLEMALAYPPETPTEPSQSIPRARLTEQEER